MVILVHEVVAPRPVTRHADTPLNPLPSPLPPEGVIPGVLEVFRGFRPVPATESEPTEMVDLL